MHQLTDTGIDAMAEELLRVASNGEQSWDQASPELRAELRGYVDQMIDKASEAEERQARAAMTNERKEPRGGQDPTPPQPVSQSQARTDQAVPEDPADRPGAEAQAPIRAPTRGADTRFHVRDPSQDRPLDKIPPRFGEAR